jgi:oligoendopeptidase F
MLEHYLARSIRMSVNTLPARSEIETKYKWNLEGVYSEDALWEREYEACKPLITDVSRFRGRLGESGATLLEALQARDALMERISKLFSYAYMRRDEDTTNTHYQALADRVRALWVRAQEALSYYNPEILAVGEERVAAMVLDRKDLTLYSQVFDDLFREKEHMLSEPEEALLAAAGDMAGGPEQIYDMLTNADLKFGTIVDENGQETELTHGRYQKFILSTDRRVRHDAFSLMLGTYDKYRNSISACYAAEVKKNVFYARARKYSSAQEASLSPDNIPVSVYDNLISSVNDNLHLLYRYLRLRKRIMGLDDLRMYDLYVPLVAEAEEEMPYEEATRTVLDALAPMGDEYCAAVRHGFESRWTDVYETPNKTPGAYSWSVYGYHPFMLLNWQDTLRDVFTLAHEMGHSIHTYFSQKNQPFVYSDYTLFVAEVASTLNEELLTQHLLATTSDRTLRAAVVNHSLEQFRTTLYRQTMFAEFEKEAHRRAEAGEALTPDLLAEIHSALNDKYYGAEVETEPLIGVEWARIPHFYRNFYVYKYSTGMAAALALSRQIISEGTSAVDRYIGFLSGGSSLYSVDLLKGAGVDITSPEPVDQALQVFRERLDEMERLLTEPS